MKAFVQILKTLFFVAIGLAYSFTDYGQIYQHTDNSSGAPFAFDPNATSTSLATGGRLNNTFLSCIGTTDGFGAKGISPGSDVTSAESTNQYTSFTITLSPEYVLNITGFPHFQGLQVPQVVDQRLLDIPIQLVLGHL